MEPRRDAIIGTLLAAGHTAAADIMSTCGSWFMGTCSECHSEVEPRQNHCDSRICPTCARRRSQRLYHAILPGIVELYKARPAGWRLRLVTLTLWRPALVTPGYIRQSYETLLGVPGKQGAITTAWRSRLKVPGAGLLVGAETAPGGMVHAHCLYFGPWVDKQELSSYWRTKTGADVVDVREVKPGASLRRSLQEVVKYCGNLMKITDTEYLVWTFEALRGKRRVREYGVFLGLQKAEVDEVRPAECPICGCTSQLDHGRDLDVSQVALWRLGKLGRPTRAPCTWPAGPWRNLAVAAETP